MDIRPNYSPYKSNPLCEAMQRYGSDKGGVHCSGWHNYTTYYHAVFQGVRDAPLRVFELGLGTNNLSVPSNMGPMGCPGASLRGWREYFPRAAVFGADIDRGILFSEDRIQTFWCDQRDPAAIRAMWAEPALAEPFDILIEDGLHEFAANKCFFENSIHKVKVGGVYIIEDIDCAKLDVFLAQIEEWKREYAGRLDFALVCIPHTKPVGDNNVIAVRRLA